MTSSSVIGVRTARAAPLRFVHVADDRLPPRTRVIVEDGVSTVLAYVAIPTDLLVKVPEDAVRGTVVAAGAASFRVASAIAELDRVALTAAREIAEPVVAISHAGWSFDFAELDVTVELVPGAVIPLAVPALRVALATQFRAVIRFRYSDGSTLDLSS